MLRVKRFDGRATTSELDRRRSGHGHGGHRDGRRHHSATSGGRWGGTRQRPLGQTRQQARPQEEGRGSRATSLLRPPAPCRVARAARAFTRRRGVSRRKSVSTSRIRVTETCGEPVSTWMASPSVSADRCSAKRVGVDVAEDALLDARADDADDGACATGRRSRCASGAAPGAPRPRPRTGPTRSTRRGPARPAAAACRSAGAAAPARRRACAAPPTAARTPARRSSAAPRRARPACPGSGSARCRCWCRRAVAMSATRTSW